MNRLSTLGPWHEEGKPSAGELILAVAPGALFGATIALMVGECWDCRPGPHQQKTSRK